MEVKTVATHTRYLGLPVIFGRSKKEIFSLVVDKVWKKIKGWKEQFLSRAGKEILIKAVAQAIPTYVMSCYKLPEAICNEIEGMLAKFWWGAKNGERKVHWMSWEKMSKSKSSGGLGFRGISEFNKSLLGKQYWRLMECENTLVSKVLKGRYFPRTAIEKSCSGYASSYAWKSIISVKELVHSGARWRIGDGQKVKVFEDRWLPSNPDFKVKTQRTILNADCRASDMIDKDLKVWNRDLICQAFDPEEASQIISIPLARSDKLIWHFEKSGEYSVRSAYHFCLQNKESKRPGPSSSPCRKLWKQIWKAPINSRVRNFMWRAAKNILPTKTILLKKGISLDPACTLCNKEVESVQHLFMDCEFAKIALFSSTLSYRIPNGIDFNDWLLSIIYCGDVFSSQVICSTVYSLWLSRNRKLYQLEEKSPLQVAMAAMDHVVEYNKWNAMNGSQARKDVESETSTKEVHNIHVDASVSAEGSLAMGCIIKDQQHAISLAACKKEDVVVDVALGEALAIQWGFSLAKNLKLEKIVIKSDAKMVVDCVAGYSKIPILEPLVVDIKLLLNCFQLSAVLFHNRCCNVQAHNLARLAHDVGSRT